MKTSALFVCTECGFETKKWQGKCNNCQQWHTLVESVSTTHRNLTTTLSLEPVALSDVSISEEEMRPLFALPLAEVQCVMGKALSPASFVLLGGEPGIGKSTLALQIAKYLLPNQTFLYVSGEESMGQLKLRAERLGVVDRVKGMMLADIDLIVEHIRKQPYDVLVIDSLHTLYSSTTSGTVGSVSQIKYSVDLLRRIAKEQKILLIGIAHITKEGDIAGPKMLEHMVDAVFYLEGERDHTVRFLRAVKNRYDAVNTLGVVEMTEHGFVDMKDPNSLFWSQGELDVGSSLGMIKQGKRIFVTEVQALVVPTDFGYPRRTALGIDINRLHTLLAVLEKQTGAKFHKFDVYIKLKGGITAEDPVLDAAICSALLASYFKKVVPSQSIALGEVELNGKIVLRDPDYRAEIKKRSLKELKVASVLAIGELFAEG
ncbi:DNA repair protein RadA [Candidatus Gracilibacteria bacterium]|nr:DNA repair protein RadA [Candidatus Gracilibacteria bacterium]